MGAATTACGTNGAVAVRSSARSHSASDAARRGGDCGSGRRGGPAESQRRRGLSGLRRPLGARVAGRTSHYLMAGIRNAGFPRRRPIQEYSAKEGRQWNRSLAPRGHAFALSYSHRIMTERGPLFPSVEALAKRHVRRFASPWHFLYVSSRFDGFFVHGFAPANRLPQGDFSRNCSNFGGALRLTQRLKVTRKALLSMTFATL